MQRGEQDPVSVEATEAGVVRISLHGEIDMSGFDELDAMLAEANARTTDVVEIDLSRVTFMDSHGIRLLVRARDRAQEHGRRLRLIDPGPSILRLLEIVELSHLFEIEGDGQAGPS